MKNTTLTLSLILFFFLFKFECMKIHIVKQQDLDKNKPRVSYTIGAADSIYSKVCEKIVETFSYMGKNSMNVYNNCRDKYELLGYLDVEMKKERPFCYDSIEQFFCNYKIINKSDKTTQCSDEKLTSFVLSTIKSCINEQVTDDPEPNCKCPSLDYNSYKITDKKKFCSKLEKKEKIVNENGTEVEYSSIKEDLREECELVTEMYNTCLDSDNLLYPNSDYRKCFSVNNALYFCNRMEIYNSTEKEIVK